MGERVGHLKFQPNVEGAAIRRRSRAFARREAHCDKNERAETAAAGS